MDHGARRVRVARLATAGGALVGYTEHRTSIGCQAHDTCVALDQAQHEEAAHVFLPDARVAAGNFHQRVEFLRRARNRGLECRMQATHARCERFGTDDVAPREAGGMDETPRSCER